MGQKSRASDTAAPAKERPKTLPANAPTPAEHTSTEDLDALLDEIDTVLEENVWVDRFVQKGGQ